MTLWFQFLDNTSTVSSGLMFDRLTPVKKTCEMMPKMRIKKRGGEEKSV